MNEKESALLSGAPIDKAQTLDTTLIYMVLLQMSSRSCSGIKSIFLIILLGLIFKASFKISWLSVP